MFDESKYIMATQNQAQNMALDLMLKTLIASSQFNEQSEKNWTTISRAVPGTTPRECQRRYEEMLKEGCTNMSLSFGSSNRLKANPMITQRGRTDASPVDSKSLTQPGSAKSKNLKSNKEMSSLKDSEGNQGAGDDQGFFRYVGQKQPNPIMVIHVCDEAKNLKQDFHCPRDLLVSEMKYFAEYLSTDAQRWEEVDISVHCDVQIFDWLMKYVKRASNKDGYTPPKLEASSVISILISSDFLKMDTLVEDCIQFCHRNMSAIVATPCNMNCINDKLVSRIADLFDHNEADDVKDRKDKFKSKLFGKLLEKLFDASVPNPCSPESAASLFRCSVCKKVLNSNLAKKISCLHCRMIIDKRGNLAYSHTPDPLFDVNDYLLELKNNVKTWRDVYWRVWGSINYFSCSRCGETFPCTDLGNCKFHPDSPTFNGFSVVGEYPCCGLKVYRFDPTQQNKGCKVRDHIVNLSENASRDPFLLLGDKEAYSKAKQRVYEDLLAHRDAVCVPYQRLISMTNEDAEIDVFAVEEEACGLKRELSSATSSASNLTDEPPAASKASEPRPQPRLQPLMVEREVTYEEENGEESDDEVGDEEDSKVAKRNRPRRSKVTVDPQAILLGAPDFSTTQTRKWDSSRSLRWNQDCQREEDQRRMNEIINYLTRLRINADKMDRLRQREHAGGCYCKLEAQWRAANISAPKQISSQFRNKPRISQLVNSRP